MMVQTGRDDRSMITELAEGFVGAIPQERPTDSVLPPNGSAWRVHSDLAAPVASIRSLLLQALHPLAMAGVHQHSAWRKDPFARLAATAQYVNVLTYSDRASAEHLAARVRAIHGHVHGTDAETGVPFSASDPTLLLWVHNAMVDSFLAAVSAFGSPVTPTDADGYCREMAEFGTLVGIPREMVPTDRATLIGAMETELGALRYSGAAREAIPLLLDAPWFDADMAANWHDVGSAAIATLPQWALDLYGWTPTPITPEYRTEVRQVLGTMDFAMELEPGVLEARQRVRWWMRQLDA